MSGEAAGGDELPFRYDARLAAEIELRWQDRWAAEGTFNAPNPAGPLSDGFEHRRAAEVLRPGHVPVPERGRACTWATRWATSPPTCWPASCA